MQRFQVLEGSRKLVLRYNSVFWQTGYGLIPFEELSNDVFWLLITSVRCRLTFSSPQPNLVSTKNVNYGKQEKFARYSLTVFNFLSLPRATLQLVLAVTVTNTNCLRAGCFHRLTKNLRTLCCCIL